MVGSKLWSSFEVIEQVCIMIVVVVRRIYTWNKVAQDYMHTHMNEV